MHGQTVLPELVLQSNAVPIHWISSQRNAETEQPEASISHDCKLLAARAHVVRPALELSADLLKLSSGSCFWPESSVSGSNALLLGFVSWVVISIRYNNGPTGITNQQILGRRCMGLSAMSWSSQLVGMASPLHLWLWLSGWGAPILTGPNRDLSLSGALISPASTRLLMAVRTSGPACV